MSGTIYVNASGILDAPKATALIERDGFIDYIGTAEEALAIAGDASRVVNLDHGYVIPGIVEAHTHLLMLGESLNKVNLLGLSDHNAIHEELARHLSEHPTNPRILAKGWLVQPNDPTPHRDILDKWFPDTPVYIDSNDLHSVWVNSAALAEMDLEDNTPDPPDGELGRDEDSRLNGLLMDGAAIRYVWSHLARVATEEDKAAALHAALCGYLAAGVTTAVDMALSEAELAAILKYQQSCQGQLPIRVRAHWLVTLEDSLEQTLRHVARAAELSQSVDTDSFGIIGIKIMVDGVLDSCTAAMVEPFSNGAHPAPMWTYESLSAVIVAAERENLQVALHAIGDAASDLALDALENAMAVNPGLNRRHRIEHLEVVKPENIARLARLGVVASMQPVHADPAIGDHALAMIGPERAAHVCAWASFNDAGAVLAFGTDAPTAPHEALASIYVATTRRSAIDSTRAAFHPEHAVTLQQAIVSSTANAAYASHLEDRLGKMQVGFRADFAVLDENPFQAEEGNLLHARVTMTVVNGGVAFKSDSVTYEGAL